MALIKFSELKGKPVRATDKEIGAVKDVYFDDHRWRLRYFIVDTSKWLPGRKVLISPEAVQGASADSSHLPVNLSSTQVESCPEIASDRPVSRQYEAALGEYYGWLPYWEPRTLGTLQYPYGPYLYSHQFGKVPREIGDILEQRRGNEDSNLRSCREIQGYHVSATDGDIGHIDDFLIHPSSWEVPYLIIDTRNWLPGRKVVVPHHVISEVQWPDKKVHVISPKSLIESSPELESVAGEDALEMEILNHYFGYYDRPAPAVGLR